MKKTTATQAAMLDRLRDAGAKGERTPFVGGRDAGRVVSGWYRTADALHRAGLIRLVREGDARRAFIIESAGEMP